MPKVDKECITNHYACDCRERQARAWMTLAKVRGMLLEAYRTGRQPPEEAFKMIDEARVVLGLIGEDE